MFKLLFLLITLSVSTFAFPHANQCEKTPLNEQMQQMQTLFKELKASIIRQRWSDIPSLTAHLRDLSQTSLEERPERLHDLYDIDLKEKELNAYRQSLRQLSSLLMDIDESAAAENADESRINFNKIEELITKSHKRFNRECK